MPDNTILCSDPRVTVASLKALIALRDREPIAEFIERRFLERYFEPIEALSATRKNGFSIMALCCLTIESLQCFREGLPSSNRRSREVFKGFLEHTVEFSEFRSYSEEFYESIRCGILHQAETTHGWRIRRSGPLFDAPARQINASKFQAALRQSLTNYVKSLNSQDFDSESWIKCRRKLNSIIANCTP